MELLSRVADSFGCTASLDWAPRLESTYLELRAKIEAGELRPGEQVPDAYARGSETILYVEDEEAVRLPACEFLSRCGYQVLAAPNGDEALQIANSFAEKIHLMITDVIMPGISGTETADRLAAARPEMKVLYVSGYGHPTLFRHGIQDLQHVFLEKPFTLGKLASRVRQILDACTAATPDVPEFSS